MSNLRPGRQDYNTAFTEALDLLNTAQKQAVDQIEGPVLVVAGPGTGKTHILAARIGRILLNTDTQAANILCLTFTDAAVIAMRERLLQFIGPDAHRIPIFTFHSFCNSIIQDNLELFGKQDMEPLSDLDRIDLIRNILRSLPQNHPLRLGISDIYFYENHLYQLFQRMKMEDWTVEYVLQQVDLYLKGLPQRSEFIYQRKSGKFKKGDLKESKIAEQTARMNKLKAAAKLYNIYEEEKYKARRYDFTDMILWVLRAFEKEEHLLRNYQERFLYLLVDEYQDTNGSQNELIRQLANYWEVPNLFIVGDDDQSIYEFQGARLKNLTDFYQDYKKDLALVVLEQNYRSTQALLDTAQKLIGSNSIRIIEKIPGLSKSLEASHPKRIKDTRAVMVIEYPNRLQESCGILQQIESLQSQGQKLNEIAVIYARHQQVNQLVELLEAKKIPYKTRRRINILETPIILKLLRLLEYCQLELNHSYSGEHLLFEILHFDFLELDSRDLASLSYHQAKKSYEDRRPWRQIIADETVLNRLKLRSPEQILRFSKLMESILIDAANLSLPMLMERLLNRLPFMAFVLQQEDKLEKIPMISSFVDFIKEECRRRAQTSISDLLRTIQRMGRNRIALPIDASLNTEEGVQLVTAHSAKGLEFEHVFLLDCTKNDWEPKAKGSAYQFKMPDTLNLSGEEDALEARRRLFYVAMTRAKVQLYCSYARLDAKEKPLQRALFLDEIDGLETVTFEQRSVAQDDLLQFQISKLRHTADLNISPSPKAMVDELLTDFKLSVSALNTYLRCPLSFYYTYVVKAPSLMNEAAAYGTAIHNSLQRLFVKMQQSKPRYFPSQKDFLGYFEHEMERLRLYFTEESYQQQLKKGLYNLKAYYQYQYGRWHKRVVVEYTIRNGEVEGVPLTGTIDKIEFGKQQEVHIVDYKTGSHRAEKVRRPTDSNPNGGSYWRQLVFYKLLYEGFDQSGRIARSGEIAYLDPDAQGNFPTKSIDFTPEDSQQVRTMIKDSYLKIMRHDFYTGCNDDNCYWCNFVKNNHLPDSLYTLEQEELDDGAQR